MKNHNFPDNILEKLMWKEEIPLPKDFVPTLHYLLQQMDERSADIFMRYYNGEETYEEIGASYGIGRSRAREINERTFRKLRHPSRKQILEKGIAALLESGKTIYRKAYEEGCDATKKNLIQYLSKGLEEQSVQGSPASESDEVILFSPKEIDLTVPIEDMNLSVRSFNCLKRAGYDTVADIVAAGKVKILNIRSLGAKGYDEIAEKLISDYQQSYKQWKCEV